MPKPYPNRRRRRKGRPPPNHHRGPRPRGYTPGGLGRFYDLVLPDVRGSERREMFNRIGDGSALAAALACGAIGFGSAGIVGAVVGLAAGYAAVNRFFIKGRFIRR